MDIEKATAEATEQIMEVRPVSRSLEKEKDNMSETQLLKRYLEKIGRVFDIDSVLSEEIDAEQIIEYYQQSELGYRVFHSTEGAIHMALNYDGGFDKDGYYEQARIVSRHIDESNAKHVLELASGKGFNSLFLARQHHDVEFVGIDLTPSHVAIAQNEVGILENLDFRIGDFQDLEFEAQTFDMLFEVESICHATDMRLALSEAYRVLKPGGRFIVIDGFRKAKFNSLGPDMKKAAKLVEVSMAVGHPWIVDDWLNTAKEVGYSIFRVEDISHAIMPNLRKFQILARGYFKFPRVGKALIQALSPDLVKNAIAGLLMPLVIGGGAQGYYVITLGRGA